MINGALTADIVALAILAALALTTVFSYPLPVLGPPTERLYGSSPILKLPFEELLWKVEGGPAVVFRRFKVRIHNFD